MQRSRSAADHAHDQSYDEAESGTYPLHSRQQQYYQQQYSPHAVTPISRDQYSPHALTPVSHDQYSPQAVTPINKDNSDYTHKDVQRLSLGAQAPEVLSPPAHVGHAGFQYARSHDPQRLHSPTFSQDGTTIVSPGIGSHVSAEKEVYHDGGKEVYNANGDSNGHDQTPPRRKRACGLPVAVCRALIALAAIVIIGLAVGLGVGLSLKSKSSHSDHEFTGNVNYSIGGAINPAYYSKKGAFNGTGVAFAGVGNLIFLFFQHHSGDLRFMQLTPQGDWIGGTKSETIAVDARNSTPLSTVAYTLNGTSKYHLFYLDKGGYIKQKTNSNTTAIWKDGPLTAQKIQPYNATDVGMQACWYGNFYGDTDYTKFPTSSGQQNTVGFDVSYGMHLWYPSDATTFQQWGYYEGQSSWTQQGTWPGMNAHAGVGCYSWGPGTVSYVMMINLQNSIEVWFKDTNSTLNSTDNHPINSWKNATKAAIPNVFPSTSLGYTTYFWAQNANKYINGYNITFAAENTTWVPEEVITVSDPSGPVQGLGGTHLTNSAVTSKSGGANLYVFYQTTGDDVSFFTRDLTGGPWGGGKLPIPND